MLMSKGFVVVIIGGWYPILECNTELKVVSLLVQMVLM